jgi:hypothetical protein
MPLGEGQCVIGETDTLDLNLYTDTNGDGVSTRRSRGTRRTAWWKPRASAERIVVGDR